MFLAGLMELDGLEDTEGLGALLAACAGEVNAATTRPWTGPDDKSRTTEREIFVVICATVRAIMSRG